MKTCDIRYVWHKASMFIFLLVVGTTYIYLHSNSLSLDQKSLGMNSVKRISKNLDNMPRAVILFHAHLAKTAGSTFNRIAARRYYGVCGHKGYSFSQQYADKIRKNTDPSYPGFGLDRVNHKRMLDWGFHNCALISHEVPWHSLYKIANDKVWYKNDDTNKSSRIPETKLLIPCRDPVDHLFSQCNFRKQNFTNLTASLGNCSAAISSCIVEWDRYDHRLLKTFDKIILYDYDDFDTVVKSLDVLLPKRHFELDDSKNGFYPTNKPRSKASEVFTSECSEQGLREDLKQAWSYYRLCDTFLGSGSWREFDTPTLLSSIEEQDL